VKFDLEFTGYIKDGKIHIRNKNSFKKEVLSAGWKEFELIVRKKKKSRSIQQNRYYFACLKIVGDHLGYSKEEMHDIVKMKFLKGEKVNEATGEVFEYLKSTTELTTTEFMEFMDSFIRWAAESFSIVLPDPNEQLSLIENQD
jgi:hypothetical protein